MENKTFWNDLAKQGAVLGAVLAVSMLFESYASLSGKAGLMMLLVFEWILVVVAHYLLLHRYTKQYREEFSLEEGFPFGKGYGYVMLLSLFAGVIVGVVQVVYLHMIIGYETYVEQLMTSIQSYLAGVGTPSSMESMLAETFSAMRNTPTPSVLQTAWNSIFNSLLFGAVFGLIISGVLARAPKPFAENE